MSKGIGRVVGAGVCGGGWRSRRSGARRSETKVLRTRRAAHFEYPVIPAGASCTTAGVARVDNPLLGGAGAVVFVAPTASLRVEVGLTVGAGAVFADPQNSSPVSIDGRLIFTNNADRNEFDIGSNVGDGSAACAGNNPSVNAGAGLSSPNTVEGTDTCG